MRHPSMAVGLFIQGGFSMRVSRQARARRASMIGAGLFAVAMATATPAYAENDIKEEYLEFEHAENIIAQDPFSDYNGAASPIIGAPGGSVVLGFEGVSQYDVAGFGRNFIPPDTMGAVGATQYMVTTNGGYGIFDKATGARQSVVSDVAFWAAAGQTGTNGDSRVMYNAQAQRWIVLSFGKKRHVLLRAV